MTGEDNDRAAPRLDQLEAAVGYTFQDRVFLELALTHASFRNENPDVGGDNERYEFLGDAVLDLVVGKWLFECFPAVGEGVLTEKKAALVCESSLARLASRFDLGGYLRLGRGEAMSGGRTKKSLLANSLEALVAAVFLDSGYARVTSVVLGWLDGAGHSLSDEAANSGDPRSALQAFVQGQLGMLPVYEAEAVEPAGPEPEFQASVEVPGYSRSEGRARTKKGAMREAAARMLLQIKGSDQGK